MLNTIICLLSGWWWEECWERIRNETDWVGGGCEGWEIETPERLTTCERKKPQKEEIKPNHLRLKVPFTQKRCRKCWLCNVITTPKQHHASFQLSERGGWFSHWKARRLSKKISNVIKHSTLTHRLRRQISLCIWYSLFSVIWNYGNYDMNLKLFWPIYF